MWKGGLVLLGLMTAVPGSAQGLITVTLETSGLRSDEGRLYCHLYASEAGFPDKPELSTYKAYGEIREGAGSCTFEDVAPGRYAASLLHDEDRNDQMKTNFIGIPREGWAVSRDAPAQTFGPPRFDDAVTDLATTTVLRLRINY